MIWLGMLCGIDVYLNGGASPTLHEVRENLCRNYLLYIALCGIMAA